MIEFRPEVAADAAAVRELLIKSFPTASEADLVEALRRQAQPLVALVAESDSQIVGQILFSPVGIDCLDGLGMGLAPMAVAEEHRGQGVGSELAAKGLKACREIGAVAAVVLGHAEYYPRFGFRPACQFGLRCEYPVPDENFLAIELIENGLSQATGLVRYHRAFASL